MDDDEFIPGRFSRGSAPTTGLGLPIEFHLPGKSDYRTSAERLAKLDISTSYLLTPLRFDHLFRNHNLPDHSLRQSASRSKDHSSRESRLSFPEQAVAGSNPRTIIKHRFSLPER
jgi:hypothetical protein